MGAAAYPIGMMGAAGLGGLLSSDQELSSFETAGPSATDPRREAAQIEQGLRDYLGIVLREAERPITSQTTVAPLPSFGGGGLPFEIAAPAVDPNRLAASRRTMSGVDITGRGPWDALFPKPPSDRPGPPGSPPDGGGRGPQIPTDLSLSGDSGSLLPDAGEGYSTTMPVPDVDQAEGAIELLMRQLQGAGSRSTGPQRRQLG